MKFSFGNAEAERVEIDILGYERAPVGEYYDDNWLTAQIRVRAGGFRGKVGASVLTSELAAFLAELHALHDALHGTVELTTLEGQLRLRLVADGKGHIELVGEVEDQPGIGNQLRFALQFDQTDLGASIRDLDRVVAEFPVRAG